MDEYIKREDAISATCSGCNLEFSERHCEPPDCEIRHAINAVPTADVVEVVRCAQCEFQDVCKSIGEYKGKSGYCSKGKPKEGE